MRSVAKLFNLNRGLCSLSPIVKYLICGAKISVRNMRVQDCDVIGSFGREDDAMGEHPGAFDEDGASSSTSARFTPEIEKKYVHRVYDAIAPHFSSTRFAKWPKVTRFLNSLPSGSIVLDAGCGNGKYMGLNPDCFFIGCDISAPLVKICAERGLEVLTADAVNLPYRTGFGDAAISIAVLHHLSTEFRRKKAIEELVRIVRKGGLVLITVWAVEQEDESLVKKWTPLTQKYVDEWVGPGCSHTKYSKPIPLESILETEAKSGGQTTDSILCSNEKLNEPSSVSVNDVQTCISDCGSCPKDQQEYFVPWHLPYHRAEISGASANAVAEGFAKKDDKKSAVVYNRYYHVFGKGELERLASSVENAMVVDQFFDKSNWCIILEKTT